MSFAPMFFDSQARFQSAIDQHMLSARQGDRNFAGRYMYMHTERDGAGLLIDAFKHIDTRQYLRVPWALSEQRAIEI